MSGRESRAMKWFRRRRATAVSVALIALIVIGVGSTAVAHDHRPPPRSVLTTGGREQRGLFFETYWLSRYDERFCELSRGFGEVTFPSSIRHRVGSPAMITLRKASPPREWSLQFWNRVDKGGHPKGAPTVLPATLAPLPSRTGEAPRAWQLVFVPPVHKRHVYLRVDVFWADEDGCSFSAVDLGDQSASWTYHLRVQE